MSNLYNVFNTQEQAQAALDYDFSKYKKVVFNIENQNEYSLESGRNWFEKPLQRLDGKWCYPICPYSDATYTTQNYSQTWFANE